MSEFEQYLILPILKKTLFVYAPPPLYVCIFTHAGITHGRKMGQLLW